MKLSRILMACLMTAVGSSALAAKFNLKMGHAVNATDGQHAGALFGLSVVLAGFAPSTPLQTAVLGPSALQGFLLGRPWSPD
jgi:hypothetical protein